MSVQATIVKSSAVAVRLTVTVDGSNDISDATALMLHYLKHDGTADSVAAEFVNSGADGLVEAELEAADVDVVGIWQLQLSLTIDGKARRSEMFCIAVEDSL